MAQHPIVHVDIPVGNPDTDGKFYAELFDWQIESMPEMNYTMFRAGDGPGGGLPKIDGESTRANEPLVYVGTDSVDASLEKATALGATVAVPKMEIPGIGWFGIFVDPSGNRIGVFEDGA